MSRTLLGGVEAGEEIGRDGPGDEVGTRVSTTLDTKPECAVCEGLQAGLTTSDENGNEKAREYRASPGILKEHALKGCLGCKLIYDGYQMFKDESDGRTWWALQLSWKSPEEGTTLRVRLMPASIYAEGYCFLLKEGMSKLLSQNRIPIAADCARFDIPLECRQTYTGGNCPGGTQKLTRTQKNSVVDCKL